MRLVDGLDIFETNILRVSPVNFDGKLLAELGGFGKVRDTRITGVEL